MVIPDGMTESEVIESINGIIRSLSSQFAFGNFTREDIGQEIYILALELLADGKSVAHAHLRYMRPFPKNLGEILRNYETVIVPEINNGQLIKIIRDVYFVDAKGYNKIMGIPITKTELVEELKKYV